MESESNLKIHRGRMSAGGLDSVTVFLPPSKSLMLRYMVYAGLAGGRSVLRMSDAHLSEDIEDMVAVLAGFGIRTEVIGASIVVDGCAGTLSESGMCNVQVRLSGVSARFAVALAALRQGDTAIDGYPSLRRRPVGEIVDAVRQLGVTADGESLPLVIRSPGRALLRTESVRVSGEVSSQFISAMLAIGPCMPQGLTLDVGEKVVSRPYLDMSVAAMRQCGAEVNFDGKGRFRVSGTGYRAQDIICEADVSAASYFMALATALGMSLFLPGVFESSWQGDIAFAGICERLGATVRWTKEGLVITGPSQGKMKPISEWLDFGAMPDVAPTLAALGPFISGGVRMKGLGTLRVKECDRISALQAEFTKLGIGAQAGEDWMEIHEYTGGMVVTDPVTVNTYDDHRIAMSLAVVGALWPGAIEIADYRVVGKTFPAFWGEFGRVVGSG
jgi:3-phosphoshikimate 1-carboxyvinyltransferase